MIQKDHPVRSDVKQELLLEDGIERLEKELADQYYQLGKGIYEAVDRKIDEINRLVDALVDRRIRLIQARGQIPCTYCLALNPEENQYCGTCGRELEPDETE